MQLCATCWPHWAPRSQILTYGDCEGCDAQHVKVDGVHSREVAKVFNFGRRSYRQYGEKTGFGLSTAERLQPARERAE